MKLWIIAFLVCMFLGHGIGQAEPVRVSLEWVELDCRKCPDLAARLQAKEGQVAITQRDDPKFTDLEKKAAKKVLVHHVENIEPGTKAKHATRINDTTFDLELAIRLKETGVYEADLTASRTQGAEMPVPLKPGTQLTPAQMKGVRKASMAFRLGLVPGQSMAIGGLAKVGNTPKGKSGPKMLILIIGLEKPEEAKRVSEGHSRESLR
ncbi:MAG: hypothetical protein ACYC0X_24220 [Pirellulaceae bacterium]